MGPISFLSMATGRCERSITAIIPNQGCWSVSRATPSVWPAAEAGPEAPALAARKRRLYVFFVIVMIFKNGRNQASDQRSAMMKRSIPLLTLLLALAVILLLATAVSACPMCKDSLAKAPTDNVHGGGNAGN